MTTFLALKNAVADDLARSDLTIQIGTEINQAIREYARHRFFFNKSRTLSFSTNAGQETYGASANPSIPYLTIIDRVMLTDGSIRYPLMHVDTDAVEDAQKPSDANNRPYWWAWLYPEIRLHPIPDAVYALRVTGLVRPVDLSADGDNNVFTSEAFDLIRHSAKRRVLANSIQDFEAAAAVKMIEDAALDTLMRQTALIENQGAIRGTCF